MSHPCRLPAETAADYMNCVGPIAGLDKGNSFEFVGTNVQSGARKCHTIDCARNTFLLLQKHLTSGTESILVGWKIVPNEEHVQCDHRFASQPLANEPLHSS